MIPFGFNVLDFGAKGDGVQDDTPFIQKAIDAAAERGGGTVFFPYTKGGYRLASPAVEEVDGNPVRAQLVIPAGQHHIHLAGEFPCQLMLAYRVITKEEVEAHGGKGRFSHKTRFGSLHHQNVMLFSDWEAPEEHDPTARPWAMIAAPSSAKGWTRGGFSTRMFSMENLDFRVKLNTEKMYPTQSGANFQNIARVVIRDCQFALAEMVGDTDAGKELQKNPCHTVGLMAPGDQSDETVLDNVAVQGFRYGLVASEHMVSSNLYCHNLEEAIVCHDVSHLSIFNHVLCEHCAICLSTTREELFGHKKGPCDLRIMGLDFETGRGRHPLCGNMRYGVYDPEGRLAGDLYWHAPMWEVQEFPAICSETFRIAPVGVGNSDADIKSFRNS